MRTAAVERATKETNIRVSLDLDGQGRHDIDSPVPFLNHMLAQVAAHGLLDLEVRAAGDTTIDDHHTVEDLGIVLGQALRQAMGQAAGINRYGAALVPMDEALAQVVLDLSGRPFLSYEAAFPSRRIGKFEVGLIEEFLRAFAVHGGITLHIRLLAGRNGHHMAEAIFKALGRALYQAVTVDPRRHGVPSTKGTLAEKG
jgi:imidazoleglycerol-phosphate dehydratase